MKRIITLTLCLVFCLTAGGCMASNQDYYEQAQRYLGAGDYQTAAKLFEQLGGYQESTEYALYAAGLYALQTGDTELARRSFRQVEPFQNSGRYLTYLNAASKAAEDDIEHAIMLFDSLGAFLDSPYQAEWLRARIPERDLARAQAFMDADQWEEAQAILDGYPDLARAQELSRQCRDGLSQEAYDGAASLYAQGQYDEALTAFEALGDTLDAQARVLACRSAIYRQAERDYAAVSLSTAEELMSRYASLGNYLESPERLDELSRRYTVNLILRNQADRLPYVVFGSYPVGESGQPQPLQWQVLGVEGDTAALLSTQVLDAGDLATATDLALTLTPEEEAAANLALPDQEQLSVLDDLTCSATPYALAQGVRHHSDGRAWWWLDDILPSGRHAMVWYNGTVLDTGVAPETEAVGIRPLLYLNLSRYALTQGSGSPEDPFR